MFNFYQHWLEWILQFGIFVCLSVREMYAPFFSSGSLIFNLFFLVFLCATLIHSHIPHEINGQRTQINERREIIYFFFKWNGFYSPLWNWILIKFFLLTQSRWQPPMKWESVACTSVDLIVIFGNFIRFLIIILSFFCCCCRLLLFVFSL